MDGTENPTLVEAPESCWSRTAAGRGRNRAPAAAVGARRRAWEALIVEAQEPVIGRTKADSIELDDKPTTRTSRAPTRTTSARSSAATRRTATVSDHGTMFVGFSAEQGPLARMLAAWPASSGTRDELTRYTTPLTGAYYFVPSADALRRLSGD